MDRNIVYPGSIPLETDILNINRNVMVGLGQLAMDVLGTSTVASGLPCTQTVVPSMSVAIGPGALYGVQPVDSSAYSSLPSNTTDLTVKQGILLSSSNKQLTLTAPGTPGSTIIYLIQAALSEVDANPILLPYYNASTPTIAYSGPGGTGTEQNTTRPVTVNVTAKAGIAATSPTAPAPDTGFVQLYYVTVAYGTTTITNSAIAVAAGAPFLKAGLSGLMPIAGGTFTGPVAGPTPDQSDNSTKLATTAFTKGLFGAAFGASGYQKLPSGLILQWGSDPAFPSQATTTINFPIPFPNSPIDMWASLGTALPLNSNSVGVGAAVISRSQGTIAITATTSGTIGAKWFALGF